MRVIARTAEKVESEIELILPEPYRLYPSDEVFCEFAISIKGEPVIITLMGTNPYSKEK